MIHPVTRVLGKFGYGPVSLSSHLATPMSWSGLLYYIFTEAGSYPMICTKSSEFMVRSQKGAPVWTRVSDIERGMYIGSPMDMIRIAADKESSDVYKRQAWSFVIGHPRSVRHDRLDSESAQGDIMFDKKRVWFKVHDIETSSEPATVMYRVIDTPVLAQNILVRDYDPKRNTPID